MVAPIRQTCSGSKSRSRFMTSRPSRIAAVILLMIVGFGLDMQVASAKLIPPNHGHLTCGTGHGVRLGRTCRLHFTDHGTRRGSGSTPTDGHSVCFSAVAPDQVLGTRGACSTTSHLGVANGTFVAEHAGTTTVAASETFQGTYEGYVTVTITVTP